MRSRFEFRPYRRQFRVPVRTALGEWMLREGFILRLEDDEGVAGFGEVAPIPWLGSETLEAAESFLHEARQEGYLGEVPPDLPCCGFAVDCARSVLRQDAAVPRGEAEIAGLLPAGHSALERLANLSAKGFRVFKWKVGVEAFELERKVFASLVHALPENGGLRLDANGGWNLVEAWRWLEFLEGEKSVQFVEDPLPSALWEASLGLAEAFETSLAFDLPATHELSPVLVDRAWPGLLVVKPSLSSSIDDLRGMAKVFPGRTVFSSAFETAFGYEAVLRVAMDAGAGDWALGMGGQDLFEEDGLKLHRCDSFLQSGEVGFDDLEQAWEEMR
ncbi:MAG: o-succinylbenzoate synthase [Opitutales bacterium]